MKSSSRIVVATALAILCLTALASAEWRVEFDSLQVVPGETGVDMAVKVYWDLDLSGLTVPIVVREVDSGAFWTGDLPYDTNGNGFNHPYQYNVTWSWVSPWAVLAEEFKPATGRVLTATPCPGEAQIDTLYDGVPPDYFAINTATSGLVTPATPDGRVVLTYTFDVTEVSGKFVFDTACFSQTLFTIFMIDGAFPPVDHGTGAIATGEATFSRGVVEIWVDSDEDGIPDHLDNCPVTYNPDQADNDDEPDYVGDVCDNCIEVYNPEQEDMDADEWGDSCDNCPEVYNPDQADSNSNGVGDACDTTAILEIEDAVPGEYALLQNFPNPFNANTLIRFVLSQGGQVELGVYDILGHKVATLMDGYLPAGLNQVAWDGTDAKGNVVSSGMYFYRITAGEFSEMKKMVLMK